jgi:hypothetical protein
VLQRYAAHPPVFVEIDEKLFPMGAAEVHAADLRAFTNAFVADLGVRTVGKGDYLAPFDEGADAIQTDLPHEALKALGRF